MPSKTLKNKRVIKATKESDTNMLQYLLRIIKQTTKANEYPAEVLHRLGGKQFEVKNLLTHEESTVRLSGPMFVGKRAARNDRLKPVILPRHLVLVQDGEITAKIDAASFDRLKHYLILPKQNNNGYIFDIEGGYTRKNKNRH